MRVDLPGEPNVARVGSASVVPSRLWIDPEGDRERIGRPFPAFGKSGAEARVAERIHLRPDNSQIIVDRLGNLSCLAGGDQWGKEDPWILIRRDDECATAFPGFLRGRFRIGTCSDYDGRGEDVTAQMNERATTDLATRIPALRLTRGLCHVR